jgi:chromosomal replication initiator protein
LIDDIQFISGKDGTQEEFFHTFNELHIAKKQIVLTADKLPSQIAGLEERLRSRFEWGLMADITIPNLETKIAIIEKKIEINCMKLNKEVINYIASNFDNSVRAIEGVLIKIRATADLFDGEINLELVQNLLKDQIQEIKDNIKLPDIISVVSNELNIKPSDLKTKRTKSAVTARRIVIFLARELTHNSMPEIAKNLGMKDHSAVSKNISKANELIQKDENFKLLLDNLKNKFINKEY